MITVGLQQSDIGNDPEKEKLCVDRAKAKPVPFYIDSAYVARIRNMYPDVVFIATDGMSPQLIECRLREGTGRYEPDSMSPEQAFWHLPKPKQFEPGLNSQFGNGIAAKACLDAATVKVSRPNFDHNVYSAVVEINLSAGLWYQPGKPIAGESSRTL